MKTFRVNLASGGFDLIDADDYKFSAGALCFYRSGTSDRPRRVSQTLMVAYGPGTWTSFAPDPTLTTEGERVPMDVLNATYDVLGKTMRFLTPFTNVNRGLLHDDVQADARKLKVALSDVLRKIAGFCDEEEDDDDD